MVDGPLRLDVEDLTLGEIEELEDLTGKPMSALFPAGGMTAVGMRGALFMLRRRDEPTIDWDDFRGVTIRQVADGRPDPTEAAG